MSMLKLFIPKIPLIWLFIIFRWTKEITSFKQQSSRLLHALCKKFSLHTNTSMGPFLSFWADRIFRPDLARPIQQNLILRLPTSIPDFLVVFSIAFENCSSSCYSLWVFLTQWYQKVELHSCIRADLFQGIAFTSKSLITPLLAVFEVIDVSLSLEKILYSEFFQAPLIRFHWLHHAMFPCSACCW